MLDVFPGEIHGAILGTNPGSIYGAMLGAIPGTIPSQISCHFPSTNFSANVGTLSDVMLDFFITQFLALNLELNLSI